MKSEPEGEHSGGVNKKQKSNWGKGRQTKGFNCSWEGHLSQRETERERDANAKTWDEAECSSHANEGLGKYSDGWKQGTVKASLVLILSSAAGFTQHSGNSATLF